jgi:DNA-binding MarR family transcriptional regulator/GNAT superfamily N-acetyltransferase
MTPKLAEAIEEVRHFNRFYTREVGALNEGLLQSQFTLSEARIVYEVANREDLTATELGRELDLDGGYLSRTISDLRDRKLIAKRRSPSDARMSILSLTTSGRKEFEKLDALARDEIGEMLLGLSPVDQKRLLTSMKTIEGLLARPVRTASAPFILRPPEAGDLGWVVEANGRLYSLEYGWDETYEALVAQIVADFVNKYDRRKERCWIAERDGENVGSVFLVKGSKGVAKLRLLIVDPKARGLGIGKRLVDECTRFARKAGYKKITLWTNSVLLAARGIYRKAGYSLVDSQPHHSFGCDLIGETWELEL